MLCGFVLNCVLPIIYRQRSAHFCDDQSVGPDLTSFRIQSAHETARALLHLKSSFLQMSGQVFVRRADSALNERFRAKNWHLSSPTLMSAGAVARDIVLPAQHGLGKTDPRLKARGKLIWGRVFFFFIQF